MDDRVVVDLGPEGIAKHLLEGWHAVEQWGVWSAATSASVLVPLWQATGTSGVWVRITLVAAPFGSDCTALRVSANGVQLNASEPASGGALNFSGFIVDVPHWLLLELSVGQLFNPAALGQSADSRGLGVGLMRIEIEHDAGARIGGEAADPTGIEWLPAAELLQPQRLDLVVKASYFQALLSKRGLPQARAAYLRHIQLRTGGQEPADYQGKPSPKQELAHFELASRALLTSMQTKGFDPAHAVPLGNGSRPLNGAHRIACAAALHLDIAVKREPADAGTWDMAWFIRQGYSKREQMQILFDLVRLSPDRCSVFVLWSPVLDAWDDMVDKIAGEGYAVAGFVDLAWPEAQRAAFESLVFDIYSHGITDFIGGFGHIERKLQFLRPKPCFLRVGVCMFNAAAGAAWGGITGLKSAIRQRHASLAPVDHFVTCHFGDTPAESQHMARTLLCPENLDAVAARPVNQPRQVFLGWLNAYAQTLAQLGIRSEDCCIVGSAALEVQGIRLATDIDFTTREAIRAARFTPGVTRFDTGIDLVTQGYHRSSNAVAISDDHLIDEPGAHVYFRGFKITALSLIRDRKEFSRRPKDLLDVELMLALAHPRFASAA